MTGVTLDDVGGWAGVLGTLTAGQDLTADGAGAAMAEILDGNATSAQVAGFIVALRMKGETVDELTGLVGAMVDRATPVRLAEPDGVIDLVGTGGDRSHSINVSTLAALTVAGAGGRVCKHGNRAASSACGTADLLEALDVAFDLGPEGVARCVDTVGIGFCFAPRFHSDAPRRPHPQGARRAHRVQLPGPAGQPGSRPAPGDRGGRPGHGRTHGAGPGRQRLRAGAGGVRPRRARRADHHHHVHGARTRRRRGADLRRGPDRPRPGPRLARRPAAATPPPTHVSPRSWPARRAPRRHRGAQRRRRPGGRRRGRRPRRRGGRSAPRSSTGRPPPRWTPWSAPRSRRADGL
ncbi:MAG: hypothetical protein R2746_16970 [Acidimicrobiales bacterium]